MAGNFKDLRLLVDHANHIRQQLCPAIRPVFVRQITVEASLTLLEDWQLADEYNEAIAAFASALPAGTVAVR